jgi:hypothetical protein
MRIRMFRYCISIKVVIAIAKTFSQIADTFNVTLAQSIGGAESSRPPPSSTSTSSAATSISSNGGTIKNTPAIVGGVVGGIAGLAVLMILSCLLIRNRKSKSRYNQSFQLNSSTAFISNTTPSVYPPLMSSRPGTPGSSEVHEILRHSLFSLTDCFSGSQHGQSLQTAFPALQISDLDA